MSRGMSSGHASSPDLPGPATRHRAAVLLVSALAGAWLVPAPAAAQQQPAADETVAPIKVAPDSPRAALARFLEAAGEGRYAEAARYLAVPSGGDGPGLARRLKAVLDHHTMLDLEIVSPLPGGQTDDRLPPGVDEIAEIPGPGGDREEVRLVRREMPDGVRWVFSPGTVRRIGAWYEDLPDRWVRDHLPDALLRPGPRGLLWWQWLAFPVLALAAWILGWLLSRLTIAVLRRIARRTRSPLDDALAARFPGPLTLGWALALVWVLLHFLALPRAGEVFARQLLSAVFFVAIFWAVLRIVAVIGDVTSRSTWARSWPSAAAVLPIVFRVLKAAVVIVAGIAAISALGYPVASLIAGLGIGGLALALAAQKTVENLFGSVSIGVDQPFRVGDFVKIEDFVGTVEAVGLRSTRIRTLDRTLITIPNGRLADMRIETFAARDRIRLSCVVGLVHGTIAAQMRQVLAGIENVLRAHPRIWPDSLTVRFREIGASSLDVEVMAWFRTTDWDEFVAIRQEVLLRFMEIVEQAGTSFAFPTRTVHLAPPACASPGILPSNRGPGA
jgi:MscS family membrane protein